MPHLVATLIYLSQMYSYYIRGERSPSTFVLLEPHICVVNHVSDRVMYTEIKKKRLWLIIQIISLCLVTQIIKYIIIFININILRHLKLTIVSHICVPTMFY